MAAGFFKQRRNGAEEEQAMLARLGEALASLPRPWSVVENQRPGRPPWVRYLVFHPDKGLALVDIDRVRPQSKIERVASLFAGVDFVAFQNGSLPLIAVAAGKFQIEALEFCLDAAFKAVRCSLTVADWPETAIALLLGRPDLKLTRLGQAASRKVKTPVAEPAMHEPKAAMMKDGISPEAAPLADTDLSAAADEKSALADKVAATQGKRTPPWRTETLRLRAELDSFGRAAPGRRYAGERVKRRRLRLVAAVAATVAVFTYFLGRSPAPLDQSPGINAGPIKESPQTASSPKAELSPVPTEPPAADETASTTPSPAEKAETPPVAPPAAEEQAMAPPAALPAAKQQTPPPPVAPPSDAATSVPPSPGPVKNLAPVSAGQSVAPPLPPPLPLAKSAATSPPKQLASPPPRQLASAPPRARRNDEPVQKTDKKTVTIDGVTYVEGRQPRSLGTITVTPEDTTVRISDSEWHSSGQPTAPPPP
jgi:hypothetical protein